ncbi:MAG: hypothetical protein M9918_24585 [Anaerolineae bacterium]|nr:hypothetical protein [Anaerolineae bacterium]
MHQGRLLTEVGAPFEEGENERASNMTADDRPNFATRREQQGRREMNNSPTQLLHDALAASARGMYSLAAAKARRAAILITESADRLRHEEVRCIRPSVCASTSSHWTRMSRSAS